MMKKICILSSKKYAGKILEDILLMRGLEKEYKCDIIAWEDLTNDLIDEYCAFIVKSVWGYHRSYNSFLKLMINIKKKKKYIFNSYECIVENIFKHNQIKFFETNNIPHVPTIFWNKNMKIDIEHWMFTEKSFVIKPSVSASGENTMKFEKDDFKKIDEIYEMILKDKNQKLLIQPYIETVKNGEYSCIVINNEFQYAMSRTTGIFTTKKEVKHLKKVPENMKNIVDNIIDIIKPFETLFYRIDFFKYNDNYVINELEMVDPDLFIKKLDIDMQKKMIDKLSELIIKKIKFRRKNMKYGVIILKPDFFEYGEEVKKLLSKLIVENKLNINQICKIADYGTFCEEYRAYDIARSGFTIEDAQKELKKTSYATYVYKQLFCEKEAMAIIFADASNSELYKKLTSIKEVIRKYIKDNRTEEFYVDVSNDFEWRTFKHFESDRISQEYLESDKVKLAYLNGIHLEDEKLYNNNVCYEFLLKKGIAKHEKKVDKRGKEYEDIDI